MILSEDSRRDSVSRLFGLLVEFNFLAVNLILFFLLAVSQGHPQCLEALATWRPSSVFKASNSRWRPSRDAHLSGSLQLGSFSTFKDVFLLDRTHLDNPA